LSHDQGHLPKSPIALSSISIVIISLESILLVLSFSAYFLSVIKNSPFLNAPKKLSKNTINNTENKIVTVFK